ncbi:MAG TPA: carboxypeptidase-like regulatory domain-containing protein [Planctomycetota bacterium]|nr:carboxypeptidase-like regulatory domain-containing protein [Planctomycetota bacterium]
MSERLDGCAEFDARLLEGAFAPSPDARLDAHLAGCGRCRSARDRYLATADALAGALASEEGAAPAAPRFVRGRTVRRAWLLAGAASLAAAAAVAAWIALRPADFSVTTLQGAVASFEDAEHIRLEAGKARFHVRRGSLEVATPLGTVRCTSGAFTVDVRQSEEESDMKHPRVAATTVAIAVTAGVAWWMGGDEEVAVPAGASLVRAEPELDEQRPTETTPVVPERVETLEGSSRVSAAAPPAPPAKDARPLPEARILGRVIDATTQEPLSGADVLMVTPEGPRRTMTFRGTSDGEGRFTGRMEEASPVALDPRLGDGTRARLLVLAKGYPALRSGLEAFISEAARRPRQVEGGFEWDLGDIGLTRGTLVRGRVTWAETGEPIAGARLLLLSAADLDQGPMWVLLPSLAQPLGRTLPDGTLAERVAPSDGRRNPILFALCERGLGWTEIVVLEGRAELNVGIEIQPPLELEVALRTEDGQPIAGALVRAEPRFSPLVTPGSFGHQLGLGLDMDLVQLFSQTSDERGLARFGLLPPPERIDLNGLYDVTALARGFVRSSKRGVVIRRGECARLEITMKALSQRSVSGRITAVDGAPIEGASVAISGGGTGLELRTDSDGRYSASGLDPSWPDLHFMIEAEGFAKRIAQLQLPPDVDFEGADFALGRTMPIEGRILDDERRPVAGAQVSLHRDGVFHPFTPGGEGTGPDGRFEFPHADEGEWTLGVVAPQPQEEWDERSVQVSAQGGDRSVEIVLRRADPFESARLVAEVVDALTGHPLDPADVLILRRSEGADAPMNQVEARRESGRVIAERLPVGAWRVWVQVRGRPNGYADVDVERGSSEVHARIEVGEHGALVGRARFSPDLPFRPCRVHASMIRPPLGGGWRENSVTFTSMPLQPDGSFAFDRLTPGTWRLSLRGDDVLAKAEVVVPSGTTMRVELEPVLAGRIIFSGLSSKKGAIYFEFLRQGETSFSSLGVCQAREGEDFLHAQAVLEGRLRWRAVFARGRPEEGRRWAETQEGEVESKAGERIEIQVPVIPLPEDG